MKRKTAVLALAVLCLFSGSAFAGALDAGDAMLSQGDLEGAAQFFAEYASRNPGDKENSPEALAKAGRILDALADSFTGRAEKSCYWGKGGGSPECMQRFASQYNSKFGEGSFRYEHAVTFIPYTGSHYRLLLAKYPSSKYAPEADFYLLMRELVGHPDIVLPRIKAFLSKYPKGEWNRRGLLLWARVNEDVWYVHRKWSWVLFNYQVSPEDLIIKAEPYRQEALRTYEKLMRDSKSPEGAAAAREYAILKDNGEDGVTYSIVNDSSPGTLSSWGVSTVAPPPPSQDEPRPAKRGAPPEKREAEIKSAPATDEPARPLPPPPAPEKREVKKPPTRWN